VGNDKYKKVPITPMKLIAIFEAGFVDYTREEDGEEAPQDDQDFPQDGEQPEGEEDEFQQDDEMGQDGEQQPEGEQGDPDRQGSIRTVPDAHMVYKRKNENNLYDELWIYKQNQHDTWTMKTYDAIVAGSDIPKGATSSPDGSQTVDRWEVGNPKNTLVFVEIKGLAN
jgi:hypothetical protein